MVKAQKIVLAKHFCGSPKLENFKTETEELPDIKDGEFLCEAEYLSVDPYMRLFGNTLPEGATMMGEQVAKVTKSKNSTYPVGSYVCIMSGWRTHTISDGKTPEARPCPDLNGLSKSLALGAVGMPATTGYFGLMVVGGLKENSTVFINGAAGAVGSAVGQMAKAKGCKVIGQAGTDKKCTALKEEFGFDVAINYKTEDLDKALKEAVGDGIDLFYDNVGGASSTLVLNHMKHGGTMVVGGTMAGYNDKDGPGTGTTGILPYHACLMKELTIKGFTLWSYMARRQEGEKHLINLIKEGKFKVKEEIVSGFSKTPQALIDCMAGTAIGKIVVKA